jgi:hypothetical protein
MKTNLRLLMAYGATAFVFTANAQWVSPVPATQTGLPPVDGTEVYFYNAEAGQFLGDGNNWGTRASVGATGNPFKITASDENEGAYIFTDYNTKFSTWTYFGAELAEDEETGAISTNDIWVDYAVNDGNRDKSLYSFVENGNTFRIKVASANTWGSIADKYANGFLGFDLNADATEFTSGGYTINNQTIIYPLLNMDDENSSKYLVDWVYVTADDYATYNSKIEAYNAATSLQATIEEAKEAGVDASAAEAVYANTESTAEEINAAKEALEQAIIEAASNSASVEKPADLSASIKNADFDASTNWTCDGATPAYSSSEVEVYNSNFDLYQDIDDMKAGVYRLTVQGFYRAGGYDTNAEAYQAGNEAQNAYLYAADDSIAFRSIYSDPDKCSDVQTAVGYIPNGMSTAQTCFSTGEDAYYNELYFGFDGGTLRVGAKKSTLLGADWTIMDHFTLTYYGNGSDAASLLVEKAAESIDITQYEDAAAPQTTIDALVAAISDAQNGASTVAEAKTKKAAILAAISDIKAGESAYADLQKYLDEEADEFVNNYGSSAKIDDYLTPMDKASEGLNDKVLSTEEAVELLATLKAAATDIITTSYKAGDDITNLIANPGFNENNTNGWTVEGSGSPASSNQECEAYMITFKIYQTLQNMQAGVYTIRCQAFVRAGWAADVYNASLTDSEPIKSYIFGNDNRTKIKSIITDRSMDGALYSSSDWQTDTQLSDGSYIPNSMIGTRNYFDDANFTDETTGNTGRYWNEVKVFVAPESDRNLTLGFVGESAIDGYWTIFDNFQLEYNGADVDALASLTQTSLDEAAEIINGDDALNADVKGALTDAYTTSVSAQEAQDGEAMMNNYAALLKAITTAQNSIDAYKTLATALEDVRDQADALEGKEQTDIDAFDEVYAGVQEKYEAGEYADDEIDAAVEALNSALATLKASGIKAGDDVSYLLTNPDFDSEYTWSGDGFAYNTSASDAEIYNKAYNTYQTIKNVPNGTYELEVVGFYREGTNAQAVELYIDGTENTQAWAAAYINGEFVKLPSIVSGAVNLGEIYADEESATDNGGTYSGTQVIGSDGKYYFIPNSMSAAGTYFLNDAYKPVTVRAVVTDNTLTVGVMKNSTKSTDWTILDYMHLKYISADTTGQGTGEEGVGIESVESAKNAPISIFDLNGRRVNKAQKGIYVIDGNKVLVK